MSGTANEHFFQTQYTLLVNKLDDLRKEVKANSDAIDSRLDVMEARIDTIKWMLKAEVIVLAGSGTFVTMMLMKILGQD